MKNIIVFPKWKAYFLVGIAVLFSSCEKELMTYHGEEGIYFAVQHGSWNGTERSWPFQPYSNVSFASITSSDTTVRLKVKLTGRIYNYDRKFGVEINPDSTTAELNKHFLPLQREFVLAANQSEVYVPITLKRTDDLKVGKKKLGLRLLPSSDLTLSFPEWGAIPGLDLSPTPVIKHFDASLHTLYIDDLLPKPAVWSGSVTASNVESGNWGEYSEKKMLLMCDLFNISYIDFSSQETMPMVKINLITREMALYLQRQYDLGNPVLESDGRLMFIKGVSWTSTIGVPWKK